jgi:hypothetical protein
METVLLVRKNYWEVMQLFYFIAYMKIYKGDHIAAS